MDFKQDDGGRSRYFKGVARDCVVRAIAIASGLDYKEVYDELSRRMGKGQSPRNGVRKPIYHRYLLDLGFEWVPLMKIGSGCQYHFTKADIPTGIVICRLARHLSCVKDHTVHDLFKPDNFRCLYGYYLKN